MAYIAPTTRTTGELITHPIWNQDVVNNSAALYAGALGITSQAANDFVYASSSSQFGRVAASSGQFVRMNSGGTAYEMFTPTWASQWPVGSIYVSVVSTNPDTLLGLSGATTWTAFGTGRIMVSRDSGDTDFDVAEETGGAKTVTLSTSTMPSHTHTQDAHTHTQDAHNHTQDSHTHTTSDSHFHSIGSSDVVGTANRVVRALGAPATGDQATDSNTMSISSIDNATATNQAATATNNAATATNQNTGGGGAHANLMPYIVVYLWKRTA